MPSGNGKTQNACQYASGCRSEFLAATATGTARALKSTYRLADPSSFFPSRIVLPVKKVLNALHHFLLALIRKHGFGSNVSGCITLTVLYEQEPHSGINDLHFKMMPLIVACSLVLGSGESVRARTCVNDFDCSLLGVCDGDGTCRCDTGWTGTDCAAASFKPLDLSAGYHNRSSASWGGRAIQSTDHATPETWHMFASLFANKCPLAYWTHNSYVARLESVTGAKGPYVCTSKCTPPPRYYT